MLANRRVDIGAASARHVMDDLRKHREEVDRLSEELRRSDEGQRQAAETALHRARQDYRTKLEELKALQPDLTDFVEVRTLDSGEIRSALPEGVALLSYYVTRQAVVAWVVRRERIAARRFDLDRARLKERVAGLRRSIENFGPVDRDLQDLYASLVGGISSELGGIRVLGILPHDVLNYLPFSALKPDEETYWSDRFQMFVAPSASVLNRLIRRQQDRMGPAGGPLVLGDPDLGDPAYALPFAGKEAMAVGREYGGARVRMGAGASEEVFRANSTNSEYLHLACHGVFSPANPLKSSLKLAPSAEFDGELTALEVFSIPLAARLVTLSACQTGLGAITRGDEIIGFNRAFLAAGANGILSSLWRVSDVTTAVLMKRFYRGLRNLPALEALQQAQRLVRRYHAHPAYWSAFVLVGSWM
jgi:CHAT domain-containing protein